MKTYSFIVTREHRGKTQYVVGFSDDFKRVYWEADIDQASPFEFVRFNNDWTDTWVRFLQYNGAAPFTMVPVTA